MSKQANVRKIDTYFSTFTKNHQHPTNLILQWVFVPLMFFGLFGLIWAVPFPHIELLGRFNGYVNWASVSLAILIYYYYRLSPVLSYFMLVLLMLFSAGIVSLEKLSRAGWPEMWEVCLMITGVALVAIIIGSVLEGGRLPLKDRLKLFLISPLWMFHVILRKAGIRH